MSLPEHTRWSRWESSGDVGHRIAGEPSRHVHPPVHIPLTGSVNFDRPRGTSLREIRVDMGNSRSSGDFSMYFDRPLRLAGNRTQRVDSGRRDFAHHPFRIISTDTVAFLYIDTVRRRRRRSHPTSEAASRVLSQRTETAACPWRRSIKTPECRTC